MKVLRFHHVSVNANGTPLAEMAQFYRDVLGLTDRSRPEIPGIPGYWQTVGDQELHLVGAPSVGTGIDPTGHHFCLSVEDLDGAIRDLEARGIEFVRAMNEERTVQVWFADPAGNTIELQRDEGRA